MERPGPLAAHSATDLITQEIRDALKGLDESLVTNTEHFEHVRHYGKKKVVIPTVFTAAPGVLEAFAKTEYAERLKATGVITSYICPLMYMNNPLCKTMPVITSSNKLRTYTSARYYTDAEILATITGGKNA